MEPPARRPRWKTALYVGGALIAAGLITAAVFGGYPPFYRAFLQAPRQSGWARKLPPVPGIEYIARVDDGFYRGANPEDNLEALKKLGIKTLINFRYLKLHDYRQQAEAMGFHYEWIPIDPGEPPTPEQIRRFLSIVTDPANRPVYVHCTLGIDRTGLMSGIYRIERYGWTNDQAVAEMEYFGHNELWMDLEQALRTYHKLGTTQKKEGL